VRWPKIYTAKFTSFHPPKIKIVITNNCATIYDSCRDNIVTCTVFAWLMIMGSGFDDWIYWHFFTITVLYDSAQSMTVYDSLHSLLDYECLPFCVTDLVLIYESVTSSASVVSWLTLHSRTLNNGTAFWIISKSKSHCDWLLVSQSILVSSPIWGPWPDIYYCLTLTVLFLWGALSE
jgi:hypothetical protein